MNKAVLNLGINRETALIFLITLLYPFFLSVFDQQIAIYTQFFNVDALVYAVIAILPTFAIPVVSFMLLIKFHVNVKGKRLAERRLLHWLIIAPPLYNLTVLLSFFAAVSQYHIVIWVCVCCFSVLLILMTHRKTCTDNGEHKRKVPSWLRVTHGVLAAFLVFTFIGAHIINHVTAIYSIELHITMMDTLRVWYRSPEFEPILLIVFVLQVITGMWLLRLHTQQGLSKLRLLQTASGGYLAAFIAVHILAVLSARTMNVDTNWHYASGENGLAQYYSMLIPYYFFAVLLLGGHLAVGLYGVMVTHYKNNENLQLATKVKKRFKLAHIRNLLQANFVLSVLISFIILLASLHITII